MLIKKTPVKGASFTSQPSTSKSMASRDLLQTLTENAQSRNSDISARTYRLRKMHGTDTLKLMFKSDSRIAIIPLRNLLASGGSTVSHTALAELVEALVIETKEDCLSFLHDPSVENSSVHPFAVFPESSTSFTRGSLCHNRGFLAVLNLSRASLTDYADILQQVEEAGRDFLDLYTQDEVELTHSYDYPRVTAQ